MLRTITFILWIFAPTGWVKPLSQIVIAFVVFDIFKAYKLYKANMAEAKSVEVIEEAKPMKAWRWSR